jgi:hypothetical protein
MAPRMFICFAKEDVRYRDFLVGQAKNRDVPFEFADMSVQEPYDSKWKTRCREKIKGCESKKTWRADGARWEMYCAAEEGIPASASTSMRTTRARSRLSCGDASSIGAGTRSRIS